MLLTAEPVDARSGAEWGLVTKVVPHEELMDEAETVARQILRNSQRAVRSAKQTILDVIGQPLDFQLRTEAWNAYTCADPEETMALLERFYEKTDAGRAGEHDDRARAARLEAERPSLHVGVAGARDRRACGATCSRRRSSASSRRSSSSPARIRVARSAAAPARVGSALAAQQLPEQREIRLDREPSPARSSRAITAQRLASTSTWKRRSRGTHSRTSANSFAAIASSSSGAVGRSCIGSRCRCVRCHQLASRSHSGSQIRRPSDASSALRAARRSGGRAPGGRRSRPT